MFIALILAFLIGVFCVLLLEAFLLYKWWTLTGKDARNLYPQRTRVTNPEFIADYFKKDSATEKESCMHLNLLLAFLWREWRDSPQMKSFFLRRMNSEFSDLMKGKAASRVIEQITIEDLSLGTSLPVITGATVMKIGTKDPQEVSQELDIALDLEYSGGCHMAIQVDLVFNKSVYLAIKMVSLRGRARLQFSRHPLTHWSFAFYEEPEVEFEAESQFEGKNLPQLSSLIINHLRKSIQKKHTLPSYKIRYSPFFAELSPQDETQEVYVHDSLVTVGSLEVTVVGCTRLPEIDNAVWQYCSMSVDLLPWSQLAENRRAMWPTFEIEISRESNEISFGLTLSKELTEDELGKTICIETIVVDSPAYTSGVMAKDILVAVDGHKIESLKQAAKMIKNKSRFIATVQRPPSRIIQQLDQTDSDKKETGKTVVDYKNVALSNDSDSEDEFVNICVPIFEQADSEISKSAVKELLSKGMELRQRGEKKGKGKRGKKINSGSMTAENSTLTTSLTEQQIMRDQKSAGLPTKDTKQESPRAAKKINSDQTAQESDKKTGNKQRKVTVPSFTAVDGPDTMKTKPVAASTDPVWNETVKFDIIKKDQYLNVCIWSRSQEKHEKDILLGYITVPLMDIALHCLSYSSKTHEECYVLVSPHSDRIISNHPYLRAHPGLKEKLCCGDITLIFRHTPSLVDCNESILEKVDSLEDSAPKDENQEKDTLESLEPPKHEFILTQFYFPTRCSYCSKKVWTKVAFQCRTCAMICHKKCLQNTMTYTHCVRTTKATSGWFLRQQSKPTNKEKEEEQQENKETKSEQSSKAGPSVAEGSSESEPERTGTPRSEKSSDEDDKKQAGKSDQINTSDKSSSSKQRTPVSPAEVLDKRKSEGQANDIVKVSEKVRESSSSKQRTPVSPAEVLDKRKSEGQANDIIKASEKVRESSSSKQRTPVSPAEVLDKRKSEGQANDIVKASEKVREAGRELFSNLPPEARKSKIQDMMKRLQVEIDEESETRTELFEGRSKAKDPKKKAVIESLLTKSEERSQALAMLMLQYCAGYQSCVEAEELDSYQL